MRSLTLSLWALLLCLFSTLSLAQSLMLSPGTLALNERQRAGAITVGTTGEAMVTFEVTDSFFHQRPDGQLVEADPASAEGSAADFVRVGPRRFVAEPGRGQQVRVAVRPPRDLAPGEYRLHLTMAAMGDSAGEPEEVIRGETAEGLSVVIPIRVARAVRVLYRHEVRPEGGKLNGLTRSREGDQVDLGFDVARLGPTSLIAETTIVAQGANGKELARWPGPGISLYRENDQRRYNATVPAGEIPANSRLCVRLEVTDPDADELPPETRCPD